MVGTTSLSKRLKSCNSSHYMDLNIISRLWVKISAYWIYIQNYSFRTRNRKDRTRIYVQMPTTKAIFLPWEVFENVQSKLKNIHKYMIGINNTCYEKWVWSKISAWYSIKRIYWKFIHTKPASTFNRWTNLKKGFIIENHNITFWIIILIAVSPS